VLFNSFDFGVFLVVVYLIYWSIGNKNRVQQNVLILLSSYLFYGLWDWRFLTLIAASSLIDFYAAKAITFSKRVNFKRAFLWGSVLWNLGVLFIFKYYNFFIESFYSLFLYAAPVEGFTVWNIIIPVGLSFYTFQTMSYTIDVYKGKIKASNNLLNFLCFVSFFPQLVAGPIERASKLLPQFEKEREFSLLKSREGLRQILWGLFKKMVVADNVALAVNLIYASPEEYGSLSLLYASALFFFQIYCDFSGYSDIAIGTAKLFGFSLSKNFNIPYLSRSVSEFWQRWHITLTRWFTDYVYTPLIKNKSRSYFTRTIALFITMSLIGIWHGANWTFLVFGLIQAITIAIERFPVKSGSKQVSLIYYLTKLPLPLTIIYSFIIIMTSCIFFRSDSIETSFLIIKRIVAFIPSVNFSFVIGWKILVIPILIIAEVSTRFKSFPLINLEKYMSKPLRWILYYSLIIILIRYAGPKEQFIYFQF